MHRASAQRGGLVINTCGWVDGLGYELLAQNVHDFNTDIVVVIGDDEELHQRLKTHERIVSGLARIVRLERAQGAVTRDRRYGDGQELASCVVVQ